jgi:hypothetical protein
VRVTRELLAPTWRTVPWPALGAGGGLGLLLVVLTAALSSSLGAPTWANLLRAAAVAGALGTAFLLDDPARHTTAAVPVPRPARQGLRVLLVLPAVALWWTAVVLVGRSEEAALPLAGLTVEAAALLALPVAVGAVALRRSGAVAVSPVAGPAALVALVGAAMTRGEWILLPPPGHERWTEAHRMWALVLVAAVAVAAGCAREPLRCRWRALRCARRAPARR